MVETHRNSDDGPAAASRIFARGSRVPGGRDIAAAMKPANLEAAPVGQRAALDKGGEFFRDRARYREKAVAFDQRLAQPGVIQRHGDVVAGVRMKFGNKIEDAGNDFAALFANAREQRREFVEGVPAVGQHQEAIARTRLDLLVRSARGRAFERRGVFMRAIEAAIHAAHGQRRDLVALAAVKRLNDLFDDALDAGAGVALDHAGHVDQQARRRDARLGCGRGARGNGDPGRTKAASAGQNAATPRSRRRPAAPRSGAKA